MKSSQRSENQKETGEEPLRLSIEKIVYGGYGLAKHKDKVVLVRYSAPKELVDARVIKSKRNYDEAQVEKVIIPSNYRREALCPHYGVCGGCQLQHIDRESQIASKEDILLETLERVGGLRDIELLDSVYSPQETGYRIKVQFKVKNGAVGFYRWGEREVVDVKECPIAHTKINRLLPSLKECARQVQELQEIHVFYSPTEDKHLVKFITPTPIEREMIRYMKENLLPNSVVGVGDYSRLRGFLRRRYWIGTEYLFVEVDRWKFRVSADSFFQVNHTIWKDFIDAVLDGVSYRKALDLHCGVGFFTLPLSEKGNFIEGSDSNPSAIRDAEYNAKINQRDNVVFVRSDAYRHLKNRGGEVIDLVLLDPPRSGLDKNELEILSKNKPERITYVSCDPSTLARDLKFLVGKGYVLEGVRLVDMFPQTYHIESVAYLRVQE